MIRVEKITQKIFHEELIFLQFFFVFFCKYLVILFTKSFQQEKILHKNDKDLEFLLKQKT